MKSDKTELKTFAVTDQRESEAGRLTPIISALVKPRQK